MKKKLIATGLITVLAASNGYGAYTYIKDTDELKNDIVKSQQENREKDEQLSYLGNNIIKLQDDLKNKITDNEKLTVKLNEVKGKIKKQDNQIDKLEQELEKAKKRNESPSVSSNSKQYLVTAYTNGKESTGKSPGDPAYGKTASGTTTQEGRTLSCPPELKVGTKLKIENVGIRVCEDTGSAIKGNRLDLYIADLNKALDFGKQLLNVEIID